MGNKLSSRLIELPNKIKKKTQKVSNPNKSFKLYLSARNNQIGRNEKTIFFYEENRENKVRKQTPGPCQLQP